MHRGYVTVHRKILDNPVVFKDADHIAVWIYLMLNATHKNFQALFKGQSITLLPGQLITGRLSIAKKLKINDSKVKRILNLFKNEQLIDQQATNQNSLITLVSWGKYQKSDQQSDQRVTNGWTTDDQRVTTNKNVNNVQEQKKVQELSFSSDEEKPKRKRRSAEVDSEFIEKMRECYPGVDIELQKRKADAWIISHPGRKMTRQFFNRWLSKSFAEVETKQQQLDAFFADGPDDETLGRWEAQIQKGEPIR